MSVEKSFITLQGKFILIDVERLTRKQYRNIKNILLNEKEG